MSKKVLVTGATGFVGSYVVSELLDKGYHVIAISRSKQVNNINVETIQADVANMDVEALASQICDCSIVIHLAACNEIHNAKEALCTNIKGTHNMLRLSCMIKAERFIYVSSIPVIGTPKYIPITEEHPVEPITEYHISKWCAEKIITVNEEIDTVILRIPSPIGVGMKSSNYLSVLLDNFRSNRPVEIYGKGLRIQNYIDVRDVASTIVDCISKDVKGLYLLAAEKSISNMDLARLCKGLVGSSSEIIIGTREDSEEENQWFISAEKAKIDMNFHPIYSLEQTIKWIINGN